MAAKAVNGDFPDEQYSRAHVHFGNLIIVDELNRHGGIEEARMEASAKRGGTTTWPVSNPPG